MDGKRKRKRTPRLPPYLKEEVIIEILVRLPVKALSVSKAWRAIISDPIFIQAHLRRSASNWQEDPCFIYVVADEDGPGRWPTTFCNHIRFYQWQLGNKVATFIHDDNEYSCNSFDQRYFSHCDGLVLAPTDTRLYVFNPATRDAITLPESGRNDLKRRGGEPRACYCFGLGLDPRIGKYKVVQGFYWSKDCTSMGMEVCTIADDDDHRGIWSWGKIRNDPPYLPQGCQTAPSINGYMFWRIADQPGKQQQPPRALLHLSLDDEEFGITRLPDSLDPSLVHTFHLDVLHGRELCLTARTIGTMLTIWTLPVVDKGLNSPWERRYSINVSGIFHTMALPPCSSSGIILRRAEAIYRYDLKTCKLTTLCEMDRMALQGRRTKRQRKYDLFTFDIKRYTESLVRITNRLQ
ncbi:hypothetical protein SETIT_6G020800v2 [Setaria italica]|uniref:F-box associated beta-propeller type 1 domain-containing protein n=1 Tax=Setaria italica TaxID=4555 RepID=K3YMQ9_SETIT|nr:hypothetical protein SETIT_6G020800v2 [Setaria italica]